ncbi:hypothetical protein P9112_010100 [Eukaryota sp. TZLM1-RC]
MTIVVGNRSSDIADELFNEFHRSFLETLIGLSRTQQHSNLTVSSVSSNVDEGKPSWFMIHAVAEEFVKAEVNDYRSICPVVFILPQVVDEFCHKKVVLKLLQHCLYLLVRRYRRPHVEASAEINALGENFVNLKKQFESLDFHHCRCVLIA